MYISPDGKTGIFCATCDIQYLLIKYVCDQEAMLRFPLKEVQSTRTQRPTSGSSYPYVEIMIGDLLNQRITQLQLEQVCV